MSQSRTRLRKRKSATRAPATLGKVLRELAAAKREIRRLRKNAPTPGDHAAKQLEQALQQQMATAEILKIIAASPSDVQPVFDAIARASVRLMGGFSAGVFRYEGDFVHLGAITSTNPSGDEHIRRMFPRRLDQRPLDDAVRNGRVSVCTDTESDSTISDEAREMARARGWRSRVMVPLVRDAAAIGFISVTRATPGSFSEHQIGLLKTFADQAVIAIENVRMFNETKEALERQTTTADILKVISSSPTDIQPVLDAVAEGAARLCGASDAMIRRLDGGDLRLAAHFGSLPVVNEAIPIQAGWVLGRAFLERRTIHVHDINDEPIRAEYPETLAQTRGWRTILVVPLMREGSVLGTIALRRREARPFSDRQIELLETFAAQAVIAIENVRLFNELERKNRAFSESLEQQTAIAEVLRVISASPTDVKPVLDAVAARAARICGASDARIWLVEGDRLQHATGFGDFPAIIETLPLERASMTAHAVLARAPVQIEDVETLSEGEYSVSREVARNAGWRTALAVPLVRENVALGAIVLRRRQAQPFSEKQVSLLSTFADQAAIALENVRLFNETKEALAHQTATGEVLRVIASSPSHVQPVFDAIVDSALRLFNGMDASILLVDGTQVRLAAAGGRTDIEKRRRGFPAPLDDSSVAGRAILSKSVVDIGDTEAPDAPSFAKRYAREMGYRAITNAPLLREGTAIGSLAVLRAEPGKLDDRQVKLLKTFADQAVIAIENVRLFNETREALERQTATSEVLKTISRSTFDLNAVLQVLIENATRLAGANQGFIFRFDGEFARMAFSYNAPPALTALIEANPIRPERGTLVGRALLERQAVHIPDVLADREFTFHEAQRVGGFRSMLGVPMLREGNLIGVIALWAAEVRPFTEKQIELVSTFADQAVIAIENVRLFNETKDALERQTATSGILKVIASSPSDVQPVFQAIVESSARLFNAQSGIMIREGDWIDLKARASVLMGPEVLQQGLATIKEMWPMRFDPEKSISARVISTLEPYETSDSEAEGVPERVRDLGRRGRYRSLIMVPLVREGAGIGALTVSFPQPGVRLNDKQRELLRTFADQAVIAIENVRLFKELQSRTDALSRSVNQLTALGQVGQAISSTLDLEKVLKTIVQHAVQLTGLDGGSIYEYDESAEQFALQASEKIKPELVEAVRRTPVRKGEGAIGRCAVTQEPEQAPDILDDSYQSGRKELLIRAGYRAVLAVPLVREGHLLGALQVFRRSPGRFADEIVDLLKTFATQSAMAIQNARLFREIAEKGKQLEVASQHKSQFLASMSHELRTPLNAILGFNEMLLDGLCGDVPESFREPLDEMQKSGKHLLRLINNVLDLAKIEAGRMELALADYSVQDAVDSVRSTLRPLAEAKGLQFVADVAPEIPLGFGDAGRIVQCLMNLAGNAVKFTKQGSVKISVLQDNGRLRYSVADTGIGIPREKIDSLFTEFKQTDATIASEYGGTGLGLSITKKFVEMHGGRIWVESDPGRGSAFIFEIPTRVDG